MNRVKTSACAGLVAVFLAACAGAGTDHGETASSTGGASGAGGTGVTGSTASTSATGVTTATTTTSTSSAGPATASTTATSSSSTASSGSSTSSGGSGDHTVFVTPSTNITNQIINAIDAAHTSIHMTMYILDDTSIVAALVNRKKAGLDVRVVLDQTFPSGTVETNPTTYSTLTAAGVGVVWRNGPPGAAPGAYTHEKTFILDGKEAWIMTLNLDHSAPLYNREYVVVDDDPAEVAEADQIFLADYTGAANASGSPLVVSPTNSRSALVALIDSATKTLDVEGEEFSDNDNGGVANAVAAAAKRGVVTRVVVATGTPTSAQKTAIATVKGAGAKVVVSGGQSGTSTASDPYIHAKAIVVDCTASGCVSGYLGSENFSAGSLGYNRELGVILHEPAELAKVEAAIDTDFAAGTPQ